MMTWTVLVAATAAGCGADPLRQGPLHQRATLVRGDRLSFCVPAESDGGPGPAPADSPVASLADSPGAEAAGFDPDLARDLAARLDTPAYLVSVPPAWAQDGRALDGTRCDVLAGVVRGDRVPAGLRLGADYRHGRLGVLTALRSTQDDLAGRTVGVVTGSAAQAYLAGSAAALGERVTVRAEPDLRDALRALETGEVDAVLDDLASAAYQVHSHPTRYRLSRRLDSAEQVALAVRADADPALLPAVEEALRSAVADGTLARLRTP